MKRKKTVAGGQKFKVGSRINKEIKVRFLLVSVNKENKGKVKAKKIKECKCG